jgi:hypothetical protein
MRTSMREIAINVIAQLVWVLGVAVSASLMVYLFGTTNVRRVLESDVALRGWVILMIALLSLAQGVLLLIATRRGSAVRGREEATRANVMLMRERTKVDQAARIVRSTRFGRWPPAEVLARAVRGRTALRTGADLQDCTPPRLIQRRLKNGPRRQTTGLHEIFRPFPRTYGFA